MFFRWKNPEIETCAWQAIFNPSGDEQATGGKDMASEDRAGEILTGAFDVLMREGLPHLSYKSVAEASGVTRQLVRYYFPTPDDLMIALCDHLAVAYREALITTISDHEGDDRVAVFLDFYFDLLDGAQKPRDDQAYDALMSLAARNPLIKENLRQQYTLLGQVMSHELRQQYPEIPLPQCEEISFAFVATMYGHWKMVASLGLSEDHKHITRATMTRLIESYRQDSSPSGDLRVWKAEDPV